MGSDFYDRLSELTLLRRAWHLARDDSRTDFMYDPFRFSDFGFRLDDYLHGIAQSLTSQSYHPKPLLTIDVPKSSLSVRPGSVLSIEDKIVLFGIACLIGPSLDKKLPPNVYSWRVKKKAKGKELFEDHEMLSFPFLKRTTIQRKINIIEPWYGVWPQFIKDLEVAYEKEGYQFMVVSDIVSYFENIDLSLLRDILLHYLPRQPRIINFLVKLLEYWAWPAVHGACAPTGIPQGNGVSSFLGNIYLLPLDQAFVALTKRRDVKYLRYMDDVKVLTRDISSAREALFIMNDKLRELRLNIHGAKTRILQGIEIREELFDERLEEVNKVINNIQSREFITPTERENYAADLKKHLRSVKGRKRIIRDKELRLFRRLMTGFTLLRHSHMVRTVLDQMERNPDSRLLNSSVRYLRVQDRNIKQIAKRLTGLLTQAEGLFDYQRAHVYLALRYARDLPSEAWKQARREARLKSSHWYVRQQAAALLGLKRLSTKELGSVRKNYQIEQNTEVKRTWVQALAQLPKEDLEEVAREMVFSPESALQRLGRFCHGMLFDRTRALDQIKSLFNQFREDIILDRFFEIEFLSKSRNHEVRENLLKNLQRVRREIHRPLVKNRINAIMARLKIEKSKQKSTS